MRKSIVLGIVIVAAHPVFAGPAPGYLEMLRAQSQQMAKAKAESKALALRQAAKPEGAMAKAEAVGYSHSDEHSARPSN